MPGCRNAAFVDVHHVDRRVDGGGHEPDGPITLCAAHHDAVHRGALVIRGTYSSGFEFVHADRSAYGAEEASPSRSSVPAQVQRALVGLGFELREAQALCDRVATHAGRRATVEEVLAAAPGPRGYRVREEPAVYGLRFPSRSAGVTNRRDRVGRVPTRGNPMVPMDWTIFAFIPTFGAHPEVVRRPSRAVPSASRGAQRTERASRSFRRCTRPWSSTAGSDGSSCRTNRRRAARSAARTRRGSTPSRPPAGGRSRSPRRWCTDT